jgi:hypothetical protein
MNHSKKSKPQFGGCCGGIKFFGKRGSCCNPIRTSTAEIPDVSFGPGDEEEEDIQTELAH